MESQPQDPEFRNNPENFHTCVYSQVKNVISQEALIIYLH